MRGEKIDTAIASMDRISQLPACILHDILSFLPSKEAARTCILSKSWNRDVWSSLPTLASLDFDQSNFFRKKRVLLSTEEGERLLVEFINLVEDSLKRLHRERFKIHKFRLLFFRFDSKFASFIDRWLELIANNYVQELHLTILTREYYDAEFITYYDFPKIVFDTTAGSLLKILRLTGCKLQQNPLLDDDGRDESASAGSFFQNFISRCPLIEHLNIENCWGVKHLQLSSHPELKEIRVKVGRGNSEWELPGDVFERIEIIDLSTNVQTIYCSGLPGKPLVVRATHCRNLRHLTLIRARIEEDHLWQNLVSCFPLLETLDLRNCKGLKTVRILSHSSLKHLVLRYNGLVELVKIDIPNLLSFEFGDDFKVVKRCFSIFVASSCILRVACLSLCLNYELNTSWFLQLRSFLGQLNKHSLIVLDICSSMYEFIPDELREISVPNLPSIEHMKVQIRKPSTRYAVLIDGFFWSCRPKTLSVTSQWTFFRHFIKILCENMIKRGEDPTCCNSSHIKCWRHYLKDVTVDDSFNGTKYATRTNLNSALLESLLPNPIGCKEIVFKLSWV